MSRPGRTTAALGALSIAVVGGCADDGAGAAVRDAMGSVVAITSQRCERPNDVHGLGIVVSEDLVLTAGHTVEGNLRELTVDGQPAEVVTIDRNTDLAVVHALLPPEIDRTGALALTALRPDSLVLLGVDGPRDVHVDIRQTLVIEHATDRATYRRDVVVFTPGVVEGSSGSPLVDDQGRLAGIVILNDEAANQGIAVDANEISALLHAAAMAGAQPTQTGSC